MTAPLEEQLKSAVRVEIPDHVRESVKSRVMEKVDRLKTAQLAPEPQAPRRPWDILKLRLIALTSGVVVLLGAGTAVAAAAAGPDSWLYPVKHDLEIVRADIARGSLAESEYQAERAGKRLDEITTMMAAGKPDYIPDLLARYEEHLRRAEELKNEAAAGGQDTSHVDEVIATIRGRHDELISTFNGKIPEEISQTLRDAGEMVPAVEPATESPADLANDATPAGSTPAVAGENDQSSPATSGDTHEGTENAGGAVDTGGSGDSSGSGDAGSSSASRESGGSDSMTLPGIPEPAPQPDDHDSHQNSDDMQEHLDSHEQTPETSGHEMSQPAEN